MTKQFIILSALLLATVNAETGGVRGGKPKLEDGEGTAKFPELANITLPSRELFLTGEMNEDAAFMADLARPVLKKLIKSGVKQLTTKLLSASFGGPVGLVFSGAMGILGFAGDLVQREKCMLPCCPHENLAASWSCKYQTDESTCTNAYSNYPGHGDHACFWNPAENRCEAGPPCRDQTFNGFSLVGSTCGECPNNRNDWGTHPQWTKQELHRNGLPTRFHVNEWGAHKGEYGWCPPRGVENCFALSNQDSCETSYADHDGDKSCQWYEGKCRPGKECDNSSRRLDAARELGLEYKHYAWRHISTGKPTDGQPVDDFTCRWGQATRVRLAKCPPRGVGHCSEHKSRNRCNQGYMDYYGDKMCEWNDSRGRCEMSSTPCHDGGIQWERYQQDETVCLPSTKEPFPSTYKVQLLPETNQINVYAPQRDHVTGSYTLLGTFHGEPEVDEPSPASVLVPAPAPATPSGDSADLYADTSSSSSESASADSPNISFGKDSLSASADSESTSFGKDILSASAD